MSAIKERLSVSMCWNGTSKTAALTINGNRLVGAPGDVQECFDALNKLRDDDWAARHRAAEVRRLLENALQVLP